MHLVSMVAGFGMEEPWRNYLQVKQPYLDCLTLVLVRLFLAASTGDEDILNGRPRLRGKDRASERLWRE
jgi:hypothetical protein